MKKSKVKYSDEDIGRVKVVDDFLPDPKDLVLTEETVKVTLSLTKDSIDFFKAEADEQHTQYQKMIRVLLDHYAKHHSSKRKRRHR